MAGETGPGNDIDRTVFELVGFLDVEIGTAADDDLGRRRCREGRFSCNREQLVDLKKRIGEEGFADQRRDSRLLEIDSVPQILEQPLDGPNNGGVARTAADVPRHAFDRISSVPARSFKKMACQCDDKSRRAEAALRRARVDKCLLDRGEFAAVEALDGHHVAIGESAQWHQTGRHHLVAGAAVRPLPHEHRAGTAVALAAGVLDSSESGHTTQVIQRRHSRRVVGLYQSVVEDEPQLPFLESTSRRSGYHDTCLMPLRNLWSSAVERGRAR